MIEANKIKNITCEYYNSSIICSNKMSIIIKATCYNKHDYETKLDCLNYKRHVYVCGKHLKLTVIKIRNRHPKCETTIWGGC